MINLFYIIVTEVLSKLTKHIFYKKYQENFVHCNKEKMKAKKNTTINRIIESHKKIIPFVSWLLRSPVIFISLCTTNNSPRHSISLAWWGTIIVTTYQGTLNVYIIFHYNQIERKKNILIYLIGKENENISTKYGWFIRNWFSYKLIYKYNSEEMNFFRSAEKNVWWKILSIRFCQSSYYRIDRGENVEFNINKGKIFVHFPENFIAVKTYRCGIVS